MHKRKKKIENVFEDFQKYLDGVSGCGVLAARKTPNLLKMEGGRMQRQFNGSVGGRVEVMRRSRD